MMEKDFFTEKEFFCTLNSPVVQTKAGKLRGFRYGSTYTFYGIRYAHAKRFRMPEEPEPWEGIQDALHYGYVCPLLEEESPLGDLMSPHRFWPKSEDCQYLNIWSQSLDPSAKKPVMVWLHGGGYMGGSSIEQIAYDGQNLSEFGDVVVVSLNHRLNILGYVDLTSWGDTYWNSSNLGHADIVAALRWIQTNIAAFGGDPNNVTLFGQSGGGMKITDLLQVPDAAGLFHKGIIMSGVAGKDFPYGEPRHDREVVEALLKELGGNPEDIQLLETSSFEDIYKAFRKVQKELWQQGITTYWGPRPNQWYTGDPLKTEFSEFSRQVPILIGSVIAEFSFVPELPNPHLLSAKERRQQVVNHYGEAHADELIALFQKAYPEKNEIDVTKLDISFRPSAYEYIEEKLKNSQAPIYSYLFTLTFPFNGGKPAWHCSDIAFAFHNTDKLPYCGIPGVTSRLEEQYCGSFVQFARTGTPGHPSLPEWPACSEKQIATMIFDRTCEMKYGFDRELAFLAKKYAPKMPWDMPSQE